jgi:hypothetical protein
VKTNTPLPRDAAIMSSTCDNTLSQRAKVAAGFSQISWDQILG